MANQRPQEKTPAPAEQRALLMTFLPRAGAEVLENLRATLGRAAGQRVTDGNVIELLLAVAAGILADAMMRKGSPLSAAEVAALLVQHTQPTPPEILVGETRRNGSGRQGDRNE